MDAQIESDQAVFPHTPFMYGLQIYSYKLQQTLNVPFVPAESKWRHEPRGVFVSHL